MENKIKVYNNVKIGENPTLEDFTIIGKPPCGTAPGQLELTIGNNATIRSGSIIYSGNTIGDNFQTGDNARIREDNIIGNNVSVGGGTVIEGKCRIDDNVRIHSNCFIAEYTQIEKDVWIGPAVVMTNVLHPPCPAFKEKAPLQGKKCCYGPTIKKFAVIGAGAILLPGVVIGENSLVGAGAVVTKDVPSSHVVTGFPAKTTKKTEELTCSIKLYTKGEVYSWRRK